MNESDTTLAQRIEPITGAVVQAFTTGNVVQVFHLGRSVPTETWSENGQGDSGGILPSEDRS